MTEKRNRPWDEPVTGLSMSLSDPGLSLCDPGAIRGVLDLPPWRILLFGV
jgi:hypothetical protein